MKNNRLYHLHSYSDIKKNLHNENNIRRRENPYRKQRSAQWILSVRSINEFPIDISSALHNNLLSIRLFKPCMVFPSSNDQQNRCLAKCHRHILSFPIGRRSGHANQSKWTLSIKSLQAIKFAASLSYLGWATTGADDGPSRCSTSILATTR